MPAIQELRYPSSRAIAAKVRPQSAVTIGPSSGRQQKQKSNSNNHDDCASTTRKMSNGKTMKKERNLIAPSRCCPNGSSRNIVGAGENHWKDNDNATPPSDASAGPAPSSPRLMRRRLTDTRPRQFFLCLDAAVIDSHPVPINGNNGVMPSQTRPMSPPVRDDEQNSASLPRPTAFVVDVSDVANAPVPASVGDSIAKFLPDRLKAKQMALEEAQRKSREALATTESAVGSSSPSKSRKNVSSSSPPQKAPASTKSLPATVPVVQSGTLTKSKPTIVAVGIESVNSTTKLTTPSSGSGTANTNGNHDRYSEQFFYKEAAEYDRRMAAEDKTRRPSGAEPPSPYATYSKSRPDAASNKEDASQRMAADDDAASECGTYTVEAGMDDEPPVDRQSSKKEKAGIVDKFLNSSPEKQPLAHNSSGEAKTLSPGSSRDSTSSSSTSSTPSSHRGSFREKNNRQTVVQQPPPTLKQPVVAPTNTPMSNNSKTGAVPVSLPSLASPRPSASLTKQAVPLPPGAASSTSTTYFTSTTVQNNKMVLNSSDVDSLSTELLLQDTEAVVKSLTERQRVRQQQQNQPKLPVPSKDAMASATVTVNPNFVRSGAYRRSVGPILTSTAPSSAASSHQRLTSKVLSSTVRNQRTSQTSMESMNSMDGVLSECDSLAAASAGFRGRSTVGPANGQRFVVQQQKFSTSTAGATTNSRTSTTTPVDSPRLNSRQSLGHRIVVQSRDNTKLDQYRGAAAIVRLSAGSSKPKNLQVAQGPVMSAADELRAKEKLEAWRRRKAYDPRRSVAEEREARRRTSSASRTSVEGDLDDEQPREMPLEDFEGGDADEFILVYESQQGSGDETIDEVPPPPPLPQVMTTSSSTSSSVTGGKSQSTLTSVQNQLKDGRRVTVLSTTSETWCKPEATSPPPTAKQRRPGDTSLTNGHDSKSSGAADQLLKIPGLLDASSASSSTNSSTVYALSTSLAGATTGAQQQRDKIDAVLLSTVYRLASKLTDRASTIVGKAPPPRQEPRLSGGINAASTESQLVSTLTELHRLEKLMDDIAESVASSNGASAAVAMAISVDSSHATAARLSGNTTPGSRVVLQHPRLAGRLGEASSRPFSSNSDAN